MNVTYKETLLKAEGISLILGGNQILRDVDMEIKNIAGHGQVIGILGPSGIGKTWFSRILAGLQVPNSGQVLITEKAVPVTKGMVGVVTQNYRLFRNYTVLKNLTVAARQTGISPDAARKKSYMMLDRFSLRDKAKLYPEELSGGQRQRIAIAQQLLCSEHFLLMDEPFTGLDPLMKDNVCELITDVASSDELNTIIVITHDIPEALAVADHVLMMGRDRDDSGNIIPGAKFVKIYDLIEKDLAWHQDIKLTPQFSDLVREVRAEFRRL